MRITQRAQRIEPFYVMEMAKAAQRIAAEVKHTDQPMVFLNIGEPDFTAPPLVQAAAERVVRDGNIITGGGVTAGIDFAFTAMAEIAGEDFAKTVQLGLEYAPAPPFESGRPELASPEVRARYEMMRAKMMPVQKNF